ncbi:hypothetical protein PRZ48_014316 [Zasmidium cellare]|uniref:Acyltransferase 3 domain-containing protein n=1 Tax=Zasmidium cellare TaxID=395010 RepID=A0ABR0E0L9_ZASCE|nr:hypothetical protein PRZ48_014316 [Zasmidium cellare]
MSAAKDEKRKSAVYEVQDPSTTEEATPRTEHGAKSTIKDVVTADRTGHRLHLTGLRGVLVLESLIWTFFELFIPTLVSELTPGPEYQALLRKIFSVPLWDRDLIHNFFIILSMRTICNSFLENPTGQTYAATVVRRIIRMVVILCIGSGMATLIFTQIGTGFIDDFKGKLPNQTVKTPAVAHNAVAAFNSLFDLFWITTDFYTQAANTFWPNATLWVPSIMYFQSFTVYFLMVILPYTRPKWHIRGLGLFSLGSFWMASWGWYSATGLMFADIAINETLRTELKRGLRIHKDWRLPYWTIAVALAATGIALKYTWAVLPQYINSMLVLHPYLDLSENYSPKTFEASGPYARLDDWFIICAVLLAVELFQNLQYFLSFKPLVWLGERSFSIFVSECIIFWTSGIKLWLVLSGNGMSTAGANAIVFIVGLLAVATFAEIFYRCVDLPSRWLAKNTYFWLVD